jgi:hypothetical protein
MADDAAEQHTKSIDELPSIKALIVISALVSALVGFGIAWGTATAQLNDKVDAKVQTTVDAAQDSKQLAVDAAQNARLQEIASKLDYIVPKVDRTDSRVSTLYCSWVPEKIREGCAK